MIDRLTPFSLSPITICCQIRLVCFAFLKVEIHASDIRKISLTILYLIIHRYASSIPKSLQATLEFIEDISRILLVCISPLRRFSVYSRNIFLPRK